MTSGLHPACFCHWFGLSEPDEFYDVVVRSSEGGKRARDWHQVNSSFFHGKFRKYSARIGGHGYLLKVVQPEVFELPVTEYLCNQLACAIGLDVPDHYMILFQNTLESFVSKNFMENRPGSDLVHIYRYLESPEDYDCEHLLGIIEKEVGRYDAVVRFIELCLFDSLIGNHDRHGRNLGLIREADRTLLAPFYDNPCYLALEIPELLGAQHEPRGAIATAETREPLMEDYVKEWFRLGFREEVISFVKRIDLQEIDDLVASSFLSTARKSAILRLIQRRYQELSNAI
ncbi:HipA domain-containing protein [Simkania negevensis]|uniref:HipA domain-containing protein n=1 Tax=Simkania negevensis TaxID=83561 RepID=A0ABS3AQP9_9BACT|nr:HipA domain-containing protein [Simkania negevensis]